ncbi:hypothetical protein CRUP_036301 [Coryphaenoides rupestris]|nr:hypothetical protein CRUP_036301 [Coryphaenoides rupestris]
MTVITRLRSGRAPAVSTRGLQLFLVCRVLVVVAALPVIATGGLHDNQPNAANHYYHHYYHYHHHYCYHHHYHYRRCYSSPPRSLMFSTGQEEHCAPTKDPVKYGELVVLG